MSLTVETLYSVDYTQDAETIQGPEFWNAFSKSTPSSASGGTQSPMTITGYPYPKITPYGSLSDIYPSPIESSYEYTYDGRTIGTVETNLSDGNSPVFEGYYWDATRQIFRRSANYYFTCHFWNPSTLSYHPVRIEHKMYDEHNASVYYPATGDSYTDSGYMLYRNALDTDSSQELQAGMFCKAADLYFTFTDGSGTNRYICQNGEQHFNGAIDPTDPTSPVVDAYFYTNNPYATILCTKHPSSPDPDFYYTSDTGGTAKMWPVITGIHPNFDDPNKEWVGTLTIAVQNKPLYMRGFPGTVPKTHRFYQLKNSTVTSSYTIPTDDPGYPIYIPESYGPFGNWTVKVSPPYGLGTMPIQQRIFNVVKQTSFTFTDS